MESEDILYHTSQGEAHTLDATDMIVTCVRLQVIDVGGLAGRFTNAMPQVN